jgi:quercetin dioxygenase-like cupin family protein
MNSWKKSNCSLLHETRAKEPQGGRWGKAALVIGALWVTQLGAGCATAAQPGDHPMQTLEDTQWGDAPPIVPPGAKIAVLDGNPGAEVPYTVRLKFPAHYQIPPHSHPKAEHVTVLQGTLFLGMGEKFDGNAGKPLSVGGFTTMPTGMNHYAYTQKEVVILLHGIGPIDFIYVNPADDPRNRK